MNNEFKKYLDDNENMNGVDKYIGIIEKHLKDDTTYIKLNKNSPIFTENDKKQLEGNIDPFSNLDKLKRCGVAVACISNTTLVNPNDREDSLDKRPKIYSKPSGFPESIKENTVNDRLIFQRCHLIGHQLYRQREDKGCENANLKRIFTGTRFMNNVMFYYEQKIYKYVYNTEKHVLYRVTPYFVGDNKLVYGVQMEAKSINNKDTKSLSFNVFVYNKQPYIKFDYKTGKIFLKESQDLSIKIKETEYKYAFNEKNKKFHIETCASVYDKKSIKEDIRKGEELIRKKNCLCGICIPY